MARRDLRLLLWLTVLTVGVVAIHAAVGAEVLFASPAFVLALPLLAGRYVGEQALERLAARVVGERRRPARHLSAGVSRAPRVLAPRGTRLMAYSLAERGPPAGCLVATA